MGLVIRRKMNEAIIIGGNVVVRVIGADFNRVRLLIEASRDIIVLREELVKKPGIIASPEER